MNTFIPAAPGAVKPPGPKSSPPLDSRPAPELPPEAAALGWPWTEYGQLLLAADAARNRLQAAQTPEARMQAEWDREDAITAIYAFKEKVANRWLLGARFAAELHPGSIVAILDPQYRREIDTTQAAVTNLEDRVEELQDAVLDLEGTRP